jgi:ribosomal-protein-alanine N-acetyltransferase
VVEVRVATADDAPAVAALEQVALGADAWSPTLVADGVAGRVPTLLYLVATCSSGEPLETNEPGEPGEPGETLVGYAAASLVADLAELQRIAVAATHRRTGIASDLLARVEGEAARRHADRVLLEVREDNAEACAFYAARGFSEIDRRPRYYADGTTAVVLVKEVGT